ncbi:hypothetical protein HYV57_00145 [Candidatus Peregrinibacteria bacterium]|nr:hypothetical protein [Candidatus Peregrinibacteria bacterium]
MKGKNIEQFTEYIEKLLNGETLPDDIHLDAAEFRKLLLLARRLKGTLPIDSQKMASFQTKLREQLTLSLAPTPEKKSFSSIMLHFFEGFRMTRMVPFALMFALFILFGVFSYQKQLPQFSFNKNNPSIFSKENPFISSTENSPFFTENPTTSSSKEKQMLSNESNNNETNTDESSSDESNDGTNSFNSFRTLIANLSESDMIPLKDEEEMSLASSRFERINLDDLENLVVEDSSGADSLTQELLDLSTSIQDFDPSSQDREFQEMGDDNSVT